MTALPGAIDLANRGFAVFPCLPNKAPATPCGFHDATRDPAGVTELWRRWPGPLIGTPTGPINCFDVLDIDPRHGGDIWYNAHLDILPPTRVHTTRSGGFHILFRHSEGVRNSAGRIAPGIDVRGEGGFVVWWPAAGYPVEADDAPAEWPEWLLELALPPPTLPSPQPTSTASMGRGNVHPRIASVLASTLARLEMAGSGQKHERLRAAAVTLGGLMSDGGFTASEAEQKLLDAVRRAGGAEINEKNARATITWGLDRGRNAPLRLEDR